MQSKFRTMLNRSDCIYHFIEPKNIFDRVLGLHKYSWTPENFALLYKAPCILHSFGLKKTLQLINLNADDKIQSQPVLMKPNSIAVAFTCEGWIAELTNPINPHQGYQQPVKVADHKNSIRIFAFPFSCSKYLFNFVLLVLLILSLLIGPLIAEASNKIPQIKMQVGESKEVELRDAPKSLDITQSDVIDVQRIGSTHRILITALRSGTSSLIARFPDGLSRQWDFSVGMPASAASGLASLSSASLMRTARELQRRTGLEVTVDNGRIALFGIAQNETQIRAILELCLEREECLPRFTLTDSSSKIFIELIQRHLNFVGFGSVEVSSNLSGFIFKGYLGNEESLQTLKSMAQSVCPRFSSQVSVEKGSQPLVQSQLSFFRVSQTGLTALGLSTTPPSGPLPNGALSQVSFSELAAKIRNGPTIGLTFPDLLLKAYAQKGVIQQIARPSVVVASGSRGEILSGGELLFQTGGQNQKFFTQNYGISVVLQPKVIANDKIVQKIDLKITHPQNDPTGHAVSSLNSSVLNTEVNTKANEILLLTRISQKANGKSTVKIPILGHLPIVGELFKSRELSGEDAELWITLKSDLIVPLVPSLEEGKTSEESKTDAHWLD